MCSLMGLKEIQLANLTLSSLRFIQRQYLELNNEDDVTQIAQSATPEAELSVKLPCGLKLKALAGRNRELCECNSLFRGLYFDQFVSRKCSCRVYYWRHRFL